MNPLVQAETVDAASGRPIRHTLGASNVTRAIDDIDPTIKVIARARKNQSRKWSLPTAGCSPLRDSEDQ
ncbi:hypothetical protein [Microbacterium sp. MYb62]|uniref:hypothetical protein n=1 Tax=Microbacterium sp. MYb62 TaxID=1848690 RepID=UPI000CFBE332|nr:hypothetical protein [Microbacterium sp. MYb62]PRB09425.1 hypothetical protein CQ042_19395 [Microbacterium sp. MYb62]